MSAYYNEFDPFAAAWLRELIKDGLIADGVVDERSITEVQPEELREFTQCHFFAGIGGWSAAARSARWSDDRPMWTGSPPCQPFSVAGNRKGKDDLRHLWPVFFNLIRECRPSVVFGEQVASAIRHGWFCDLQTDLEAEGYASAMAVLPACGVNAPHKRDRLFYVAERLAESNGIYRRAKQESRQSQRSECGKPISDSSSDGERVGDTKHNGSHGVNHCSMANAISNQEHQKQQRPKKVEGERSADQFSGCSMANTDFWRHSQLIYCRDGKHRPIPTEPALFPLANDGFSLELVGLRNASKEEVAALLNAYPLTTLSVPNRVGILKGAGNAIVPAVGAEIIKAYMGRK